MLRENQQRHLLQLHSRSAFFTEYQLEKGMLTLKMSSERERTPTPPHMGLRSPTSPGLISRKRPLDGTPSPQHPRAKVTTSTYRQEADYSTSSSQTTPKAQMTRNADEHGITDVSALKEAAQDNQFQRLIEEEEEEEKAAQDLILQPLVEEEEGGPSEAASKGKSENEIEHVGSAFLSVVTMAIEATEKNHNVDKTILDAQNLEMHLEWVARKTLDLEIAKRR